MTTADTLVGPQNATSTETGGHVSADVATTALELAGLGYPVHPLKPRNKRPSTEHGFKDAVLDPDEVAELFAGHTGNVGIATGHPLPSGGYLLVIDVDEHNPAESGSEAIRDLSVELGPLPDTYTVHTPSDGRHLYYSTPEPLTNGAGSNLPDGIDIRALGGYVVAPGSQLDAGRYEVDLELGLDHGVAELPAAWYERLKATRQPTQPAQRPTSPTWANAPRPTTDRPGDAWAAAVTWADLLTADGWQADGPSGDGGEAYIRPGKTRREGPGATVNYKGSDLLKVFTSSAPPLKAEETYTKLGYLTETKFAGDYNNAVDHLRTLGYGAPATSRSTNVDPDTGEILTPNLPASFWNERPVLEHIRDAAYSRGRAPDAVLGAVLARAAILAPATWYLPAIVGAPASVNVIVAAVAPSGGGKSTADAIAAELLPIDEPEHARLGIPVGSGEGLIAGYLGTVTNPDTKKAEKRQIRQACHFMIDEGQVLAELGSRKGSTIMPVLRSAWSGSTLGMQNASEETSRMLPAGSYRFAAYIALQPEHATAILDDAGGGTPQRFIWVPATDPNIPDWRSRPTFPGPLELDRPNRHHWTLPTMIAVDDTVADEIRDADQNAARGGATDLDGHAGLNRLKVAALLAVLDGRRNVSADDWRLAATIMRTSNHVRAILVEQQRARALKAAEAGNRVAANRALATVDSLVDRAREAVIRAMARKAHREGPVTRRDLDRAPASKDRSAVDLDECIALAVERGQIIANADGTFSAGRVRP